LFFQGFELLALFGDSEFLRFNLFLERSLQVAQPLNFFFCCR
jgi:hypothetical protein